MLDNAIEAASQVPGGEITVSLRVNQGYLAIKCENSYQGPLSLDEDNQLRTTKPEQAGHGFGILQMRSVAEKYRGMFDLSYTDDRFTVTAALKLPIA